MALGGVHDEHLWDLARVWRLPLDCDHGVAFRAFGGIAAWSGGASGGSDRCSPHRSMGRISPKAWCDDRDGSDPFCRVAECSRRVYARLVELRSAPGRFGYCRHRQHHLYGSQRLICESACAAGGPDHRKRAVRIYDLDRHHNRTTTRWDRHRATRSSDDGSDRCGELSPLGAGDRSDQGGRNTSLSGPMKRVEDYPICSTAGGIFWRIKHFGLCSLTRSW